MKQKNAPAEPSSYNEPWLSQRTGLITITVLSIVLAAFMIWNLYPSEGAMAILWGLGFGASIWAIFGLSFLFNKFLRGKR
jgi:hypothetical protein